MMRGRTFGLVGINLELANVCPYRCPQCYVPLAGEEHFLPREKALYWIRQADRHSIRYVNMSGGETLCYPHLEELISECARRGMKASVSLSGAFASKERLQALHEAGVSGICISLNGSTREINDKTRQGFEEAIAALAFLREMPKCTTLVNFVMHGSNGDDLPGMLRLLEQYRVQALVILGTMPSADGKLRDVPSARQIQYAARVLAQYKGPVGWLVNSCFHELRSLLPGGNELDAEGEVPVCTAARTHLSVTADGKLAPCNHLNLPEEYDTIEAYLRSSETVQRLHEMTGTDPLVRPCMQGRAPMSYTFRNGML